MSEEKRKLTGLFLNEKAVRILISLCDENINTPADISKEIGCFYTYTLKVLNELESLSLVKSKKVGRIRIVELTEKGEKIAGLFDKLMIEMKGD